MDLRDKNILLISPEPWDHIFVSKHHYAMTLAKRGNRVYFLNPPDDRYEVDTTGCENVMSVAYRGFVRGLRFYPRPLRKYFIRREYQKLQMMCGTPFDIVWSFDNSVLFDFSVLPSNVFTISHIVDLNQDFQFGFAAKTASLCLGSSRSLVARLRQYNTRSHFIGHGYAPPLSPVRFQLPSAGASVRVGYAGNLDLKYIDWPALQRTIEANGNVAFFFAGPFNPASPHVRWLQDRANVTLLGRLSQADVLAFYRQMDILLLCYRCDKDPGQLDNPHKMMEYLGSGKVIVATATAEYRTLEERHLILMSRDNAEFPEKFAECLQDLSSWNHPDKQRSRTDVALDNTYDKQLDRIGLLLKTLLTS